MVRQTWKIYDNLFEPIIKIISKERRLLTTSEIMRELLINFKIDISWMTLRKVLQHLESQGKIRVEIMDKGKYKGFLWCMKDEQRQNN